MPNIVDKMHADTLSRLNDSGTDLAYLATIVRPDIDSCMLAGNRLLVSAMQPFRKPEVAYLSAEYNVRRDQGNEEIPDGLRAVLKSAHGALLHSFAQAHRFCDGGINDIASCTRLSIAVCTTPNFENLGYIQAHLRQFAKSTFSQKYLPAASTYGVAALPGQSVVTVEAEYEIRIAE